MITDVHTEKLHNKALQNHTEIMSLERSYSLISLRLIVCLCIEQ